MVDGQTVKEGHEFGDRSAEDVGLVFELFDLVVQF